MLHLLREAHRSTPPPFSDPVELDETYVGGKRRYMSNAKRQELEESGFGNGPVGKAAVVGAQGRASYGACAEAVGAIEHPPCTASWPITPPRRLPHTPMKPGRAKIYPASMKA
ncbi:MAG: transposase [Gammaproteobacteria bacterium]|nr:transposase [Gammaproteobacteria bacterium]